MVDKKKPTGKPAKIKKPELDLGDGPGVGRQIIPEIEAAAADYYREKERRRKQTPKEVAAKTKLMDVLHKHEKAIGRDADGVLTYRYDEGDLIIRLVPGEEKLTVRAIDTDSIE